MKVLVSGSHGLIGAALLPALRAGGHDVVVLVRGEAGAGEIHWDPAEQVLEAGDLAGVDAAVHLAGEPIADKRWSSAQKQKILDSRLRSTELLSRRLADVEPRPSVLLSGSAIGYYGDRGDDILDEASGGGTGFLADVCRQWEAATAPAEAAGIRVAHLRTGIVYSAAGGALKKQLPLFKLFVGGRLGSGRQYQSWITIDDEVGAIVHTLGDDSLTGAVNLTAPHPVTNAGFTKALASVLGRPAVVPVPGFALSAALGREMADEMLLGGQRVLPRKLESSGYRFTHPEIEAGLRAVLAR
jgi:uncharacterized protein (TIGR01777 family)